jgi:hypothetical protein
MNRSWTRQTTIIGIALAAALGIVLGAVAAGLATADPQPTAQASAADNPGTGLVLDLYMRGTDQSADLTQPPQPGQQNLLGSDLYALGGSDASPTSSGQPVGRRIGVCTVATAGEALCDGIIDLGGRGTISAQLEVLLPGGNQGIAITGGTGEFAGATGTITESPVAGHPHDRVLELRISGFSRP